MTQSSSPSPMVGYGLGGCGCLLSLVSALVALFCAFHVFIDPEGNISGNEAAPAMVGAGCCTVPSLLLVAGGVFLAMRAKRAAEAAATTPT